MAKKKSGANSGNVSANVPKICKRFKSVFVEDVHNNRTAMKDKHRMHTLLFYSPVEALHFISVRSTMRRFSTSGLFTFSSTSSAARRPISPSGGSTVVSFG